MKNKCCSCKFADWRKTKNGTLHRSGDGTCTWEINVTLPASISRRFRPLYGEPSDTMVLRGSAIDRFATEPKECAVYTKAGDEVH